MQPYPSNFTYSALSETGEAEWQKRGKHTIGKKKYDQHMIKIANKLANLKAGLVHNYDPSTHFK